MPDAACLAADPAEPAVGTEAAERPFDDARHSIEDLPLA